MQNKTPITLCWFRRDLRLHDQSALSHALKSGHPVLCVFIFDKEILDRLEEKADRRVTFLHDTLSEIKEQLKVRGSDLCVKYGTSRQAWEELTEEYTIRSVYTNRDYEPYPRKRDEQIGHYLQAKGIAFHTCKDQVIFEPGEVLKDDGKPYTVYTPFANKWLAKKTPAHFAPHVCEIQANSFLNITGLPMPSLAQMGFIRADFPIPPLSPSDALISHYEQTRNFPALQNGTSHLGIHLRFGTVSIRELALRAESLSLVFLKELIWREFFMQILFHFPRVENHAFRPEYDRISWRNDETEFLLWCEGRTGYPMVDAGMRELNATGFMHNRVRMVTASFLTKHLLIDWRLGERYFARKLLDFDLSANNGNWQWAAGCGCDAAPYFRVFNPQTQAEKFDPKGAYIRTWVPEFDSLNYSKPVVDHKMARERVLRVFKEALNEA
jgi:deoxyribodipyrimidine photo-lyase